MIDALYIGASGMHAQQMHVDVIANNLANINTDGYKRNRVDFEDLLYRTIMGTNGLVGTEGSTHKIGSGATISSTSKLFTPGSLKPTDSAFDIAIRGQGFFEIELSGGVLAYTRAGTFQVNRDGMLATSDDYALSAQIQVPSDTISLIIKNNGMVYAQVPGESNPVEIGQIPLFNFTNAGGLEPIGGNLYLPTNNSGDAFRGNPGEDSFGSLAQGFKEASNVKLIDEMVNLVMAQRAYEINAKVVQAADEMLRIINSLYR